MYYVSFKIKTNIKFIVTMLGISILLIFIPFVSTFEDQFMGCYRERLFNQTMQLKGTSIKGQCLVKCKQQYYRYALINLQNLCSCRNYLNQQINNTLTCSEFCGNCDDDQNIVNVYSTGNLIPGPPRNVIITNITETSIHIRWQPPESYTDIKSYQITANIIHTYSSYTYSPIWTYSNDTFQTQIITLIPSTQYNISICAISKLGQGPFVSKIIQTNLGEPDNLPEPPIILNNKGSTIDIKIMEVSNNNGPITSYLVVVMNQNANQIFQKESLKSYDESKREGIDYYIAAELDPKDINKNFTVGDGQYYRNYFNAPLNQQNNYKIILGIKSELNGITKTVYSQLFDSFNQNNDEKLRSDSPIIVITLSIAIGLLSFMLIIGIIGFIILKSRIATRRQRLSDNQELTLQGPVIEVENNGYIPEEEHHTKSSYYKQLKEKVHTIPYSHLKIEPTNLLGIGRFGRVNMGKILENNTQLPVTIYSISDKKLNQDDRKAMLKELDILIRSGKHDNIIELIGTCETPQMVFIIFGYGSMNLKDLLLGSRDSLPGRFSNMTEIQALDFAIGIAKGMAHLESNKIIHKQLCARSVLIINETPKISAYGIAQYYSHNNLPDYTRWTALEVFKGQEPNIKSDVWSFGCLLWEICVLGGTPYGNFSNNEIPDKITKGLRLQQLQYFSDDLYQIMLNCWQIDLDERPNFIDLIDSLENLKTNNIIPFLCFNLYSSFQYEQFYPDMEIAIRPVF